MVLRRSFATEIQFLHLYQLSQFLHQRQQSLKSPPSLQTLRPSDQRKIPLPWQSPPSDQLKIHRHRQFPERPRHQVQPTECPQSILQGDQLVVVYPLERQPEHRLYLPKLQQRGQLLIQTDRIILLEHRLPLHLTHHLMIQV